MLAKKGLMTSPSAVALYIEDVFSTYLYTGEGGTKTITNNIDLSGEGGMIWVKARDSTAYHGIWDTARGAGTSSSASKALSSNLTVAESAATQDYISSFNNNGFAVTYGGGTSANYLANRISLNYASWTFRKAEKFFDVVTYTGNGTAGRTISHNLGSVPGTIIVKAYSGTYSTTNWAVYHRSLGATKCIFLNTTDAVETNIAYWNNTEPTSTQFTVGDAGTTNDATCTYVAYLFAHDAGGFGDDGDQSVIKCGSYTGNGSATGPTITLDWEPQWVLIKQATDGGTRWTITDNMRGFPVTSASNQQILQPHVSDAEAGVMYIQPTSTGFKVVDVDGDVNTSGKTYIYIAIRRGPMKTPTTGTSVFDADTYTGDGGVSRLITTGFVTDMSIIRDRNSATEAYRYNYLQDRLRAGGNSLATNANSYEASDTGWDNTDMRDQFRSNTGILVTVKSARYNANSASYVTYNFARAPGFFDIVAYTGTGANATITHNLGVAPELIITKRRLSSANWATYNSTIGNTKYLVLNENDAATTDTTFWNSTSPTSTTFSLGSAAMPNQSTQAYIAYLFATLPGISKVGTYTGTATTNQINCGFTSGARFVMIKRTDTNGAWYIWDTARGIITGNDPYIFANGLDTEVTNTDYIDPYTSGFEISSTAPDAINASGGTFIYLAIA